METCRQDVLRCVEGAPRRGQGSLSGETIERFNAAVEVLERDGGVEVRGESDASGEKLGDACFSAQHRRS